MIPLADPMGRVIGFTARDLDNDPSAPKYINTPQTILYDKSRHIFGLNLAKDAIRIQKYAVVVEGNLDVIASHQAGIAQVVATAGTAITEYHLKGISRFAGDIRLSFDQDDAGIRATERAIGLASKLGVNLSVITIPGAKDPDELIKQDPNSWKKIIENAEYGLDWLIGYYQSQINISDGKGKREFSDLMLNVIKSLNDPVEQEHYLIKVAKIIGVSIEALKNKVDDSPSSKKLKKGVNNPVPLNDPKRIEFKKLQDHLLCLVLVRPELRQFVTSFNPEMMADDLGKKFLQQLLKTPDLTQGDLAKIAEISDYVKILQLQYEDLYEDLDPLEQHYETTRLQTQFLKAYVWKEKQQISAQLNNSNDREENALLEKVKELDALLKSTSGTS
jgi:DNA primase